MRVLTLADPERFTVDGVTFIAAATAQRMPYYWRPEVPGLAFSIYRVDQGQRPYVAGHTHFKSLEAAGRGAITKKAAEIELWRQAVEEHDRAKLKLADMLALTTPK
jgi:hypothetical protein